MIRTMLTLFVAASLLLFGVGCDKKPQRTQDDSPVETGAQPGQPDAHTPPDEDGPRAGGRGDADTGGDADTTEEGQPTSCPEPRDYQGMCAQVVTWALDPDTGHCCQYSSPCEVPEDWQTFSSESECQQGAKQP